MENLRYRKLEENDENSDNHLSENSTIFEEPPPDLTVQELLELFKSDVRKFNQRSQANLSHFENELVKFREVIKT
jgi:hypothetical protein